MNTPTTPKASSRLMMTLFLLLQEYSLVFELRPLMMAKTRLRQAMNEQVVIHVFLVKASRYVATLSFCLLSGVAMITVILPRLTSLEKSVACSLSKY